ncbi:Superfamily I DNA or RNA helicase [Rhizobium aethiopicum]|uniref:DNA 3'-5' helicase n=1 Tax=Rhizobium aethiopicum TaxID=1138170 RepID=A0A1C3YBL7_9HYPH|nr:ATP-dependent helicase [Rhizobium aethiopicum]SCB61896.1 Superfamily I DNA or RNA helicase [Rhizobium aethiopicum]
MTYLDPGHWKPSKGVSLEGDALEIVRSTNSRSILAGPGAGKTELLAQRANFLLTTGACPNPRRILAVAFKVDAARNLQERVAARCDPNLSARFESLTLHSFAKRLLDQFLEALPKDARPSPGYRIFSPNRGIWDDFRNSVSPQFPSVMNYNDRDLYKLVHSFPSGDLFANAADGIRSAWWTYCIGRSTITFEMVMLLAVRILETQKSIVSALRQTYSHVFLDEFQDVNELQYRLIKAAFHGGDAVVTAVGDTNQAIMAWAGALPDIFNRFNVDFAAVSSKLLFNFRSNRPIVTLINSLASMFEANPVMTQAARKDDPVPPDAIEGWVFKDREAEGEYIARFIQEELGAHPTRVPDDFVLLARVRVDNVEQRIKPHFVKAGLRLRNESRKVGELEIQDLMKEQVFRFIMAALKMAVGVRQGDPFQVCRDTLADLDGHDISTERGSSSSLQAVQRLVSDLSGALVAKRAADISGQEIVNLVMSQSRRHQFSRAYNEYRGSSRLAEVVDAFCLLFDESARQHAEWKDCVDLIEGRGVVKLMTIHKSKGLEFHTVIFVELNDDAFWKSGDDANVFLVALSRARERIKFTFAQDSRGFKNVQDFLDRLGKAGVIFLDKP